MSKVPSSSASDEFIEIFNPCSSSVNLTGWKLIYHSASGSSDVGLFEWTSGSLAGGAYQIIVGSAWSGSGTVDGTIASGGLSATGGGVGLKDDSSVLVDSMGYGSASNEFVEGSPAQEAAEGSSVGRMPNGVDTDDNASDFAELASPSPRGPNH